MNRPCDCCEGTHILTPRATANRPGLSRLVYRVGSHATFFETMQARLSSQDYPELATLRTREKNDPSIALLDAWATVADLLTFYQERIANEGYLRTATERRSILELARLIGYALRPGVSASVYLAYSIEKDATPVEIPKGARANSIPAPGEQMQAFETAEPLKARVAWNELKPRMTQPQNITRADALILEKLYLRGTDTNIKSNDRLLLVFGHQQLPQVMRRVKEVLPDPTATRTEVLLQAVPYLVAAFVPLLLKFDAMLKKFADTPTLTVQGAQLVALYQNAVELIIENIQLGNYPPLTSEYFNHQRLYRLLRGDRDVIDELTAFLPRDPADLLLQSKRAATASVSMSTSQTNTAVVVPLVSGLIGPLIDLLKDDAYRRALLDLLTHLAEQLKPTSLQDRLALGNLLVGLNTLLGTVEDIPAWIDEQYQKFMTLLREAPWKDASIMALIAQLVNLLGDPSLRKALNDLLDGLTDLSVVQNNELIKLTKVGLVAANLKYRLNRVFGAEPATTVSPVQVTVLDRLIKPLNLAPRPQFANSLRLPRDIAQVFQAGQDTIPQLLVNFAPALGGTLYQAWANAEVATAEPELQAVYALRLTASLFGYNAPRTPVFDKETGQVTIMQEWSPASDEGPSVLFLDNEYSGVIAGSYAVIQKPEGQMMSRQVVAANSIQRSEYNLNGKSTRVGLSSPWRLPLATEMQKTSSSLVLIRRSVVYAQSEPLNLAEEPITDDLCRTHSIALDSLIDGLKSGRWLIVSGERTDVSGASGVRASELVMLAGMEQRFDAGLPGDRMRTALTLAKPLTYCYKRDTVAIYGNVVKATHGETRQEVLGSGDAAKALQTFILKQPPLTYVSAPTVSGVESTLEIRVNDVQWHEVESITALGPNDRKFVTRNDDDAKTMVTFGNGERGARLPTGQENVKATYRNGIGKPGNVKAGQISLLSTRPLGVKGVINPIRASGGADKENRDQARKNAPLAVMALDRLVSTQDYADFARTFAGIGKAAAVRLTDGRRQLVHVAIAGTDDIPIETTSDLYRNLLDALHRFGDPYLPIRIEVRERLALVISARVRIHPDYQWETLEPKIRAAVLDVFSFENVQLGEDLLLSNAIKIIQGVRGVTYVDVDVFDRISETQLLKSFASPAISSLKLNDRIMVEPARVDKVDKHVIKAAQLAYLTPEVPDTLILQELKP